MVIEHTFVTKLDAADAMRQASEYLSARGFERADGQPAFPVGPEAQAWTSLEMRRGKKRAARAKNVAQLPQTVRVDYDRGRVNVAMSIGANAAWGGASAFTLADTSGGKPKKMMLHTQLLNSIAVGLEQLLSYQGSGAPDYGSWDQAERDILAAARKRSIRNWIIFAVVFGLLGLVITLIILNAR